MLLVETILAFSAALLAFVLPGVGTSWLEKIERAISRLAQRQRLAVVVVGVAALAARAALLPIEPIPHATVHDEFSYLLMSDTFAHRRLSNPTHPLWIHFETFYVNQQPTYVSKYFPGQGMALAVGQALFGHPFWGVWLSIGAMCAALTWMLQGWLPPSWALVGGLIAIVRLATFNYWANSYFGGAVTAIGGALVLGAYPRLLEKRRVAHSFLLGIGFALLATSRPLEGMIFSLPVAFALLLWFWRKAIWKSADSLRTAGPVLLVLALTAAGLLYYCWRTTGSPFKTPYQVNLETQDPVPIYPWQNLRTIPQYQHPEMKTYFLGSVLQIYQLARSHFVIYSIVRVIQFYLFFIGPALTVALLGFFAKPKDFNPPAVQETRRILPIVFGLSAVTLLLPIYYSPAYAAALTCIIYLAIVSGMRRLRSWQWRDRPIGLAMAMAVPVICVLMLFTCAFATATKRGMPAQLPLTWCSSHLFESLNRSSVEATLNAKPGGQLAIVHYSSGHFDKTDWVHNLADIDSAKVIWARDMGQKQNEELIRYYPNRQAWLIKPDDTPPSVSQYKTSSSQ